MFPWWLSCLKIYLQCWRPEFDPRVGETPWRREWLPTPVFWPGESHGQRSLAGSSPWGLQEPDTAEELSLSLSQTSIKPHLISSHVPCSSLLDPVRARAVCPAPNPAYSTWWECKKDLSALEVNFKKQYFYPTATSIQRNRLSRS